MQINYKRPYLTSYQKAILDSPARYTITAASTKTGKTASHIIWLFEQSLKLKENHSADSIPDQEIVKKWWAYMQDIMETKADHSPVEVTLQEVFYMD